MRPSSANRHGTMHKAVRAWKIPGTGGMDKAKALGLMEGDREVRAFVVQRSEKRPSNYAFGRT